jgi:hypothetical protein
LYKGNDAAATEATVPVELVLRLPPPRCPRMLFFGGIVSTLDGYAQATLCVADCTFRVSAINTLDFVSERINW